MSVWAQGTWKSINWFFDSNEKKERNWEKSTEMKRCKYLAWRKFDDDVSYQIFFSVLTLLNCLHAYLFDLLMWKELLLKLSLLLGFIMLFWKSMAWCGRLSILFQYQKKNQFSMKYQSSGINLLQNEYFTRDNVKIFMHKRSWCWLVLAWVRVQKCKFTIYFHFDSPYKMVENFRTTWRFLKHNIYIRQWMFELFVSYLVRFWLIVRFCCFNWTFKLSSLCGCISVFA